MNFSALKDIDLPPSGSVIAVALSGGVDSSLAIQLMAERGYRVIGVTMKTYDAASPVGGCQSAKDEATLASCAELCSRLNAEYRIIDLADAYRENILHYFQNEYKAGRTPNPCVHCNPLLKFKLLPEALSRSGLDFDYFATGHYVRLVSPTGVLSEAVYLRPGLDLRKDQSYFLHRLSSEKLQKLYFPLGSMTKQQVREEAVKRGLAAAGLKDSQDFGGEAGYASVFNAASLEGDFIDLDGNILGRHKGLEHYTIGQRRGLGVPSSKGAWYVAGIDAKTNRVLLGGDADLYKESLTAKDLVWAPGFGRAPFRAYVKIRSTSRPVWASIRPMADMAAVLFDEAQRAIAPGQAAVFYAAPNETAAAFSNTLVAGGGIIADANP